MKKMIIYGSFDGFHIEYLIVEISRDGLKNYCDDVYLSRVDGVSTMKLKEQVKNQS